MVWLFIAAKIGCLREVAHDGRTQLWSCSLSSPSSLSVLGGSPYRDQEFDPLDLFVGGRFGRCRLLPRDFSCIQLLGGRNRESGHVGTDWNSLLLPFASESH